MKDLRSYTGFLHLLMDYWLLGVKWDYSVTEDTGLDVRGMVWIPISLLILCLQKSKKRKLSDVISIILLLSSVE